MIVLEILFWALVLGLLVKGIYRTKHIYESLNWLRSRNSIAQDVSPKLFVIIPAYKEQKVIADTTKYFAMRMLYSSPQLHVVVVTTEAESNDAPTTYQIAKKACEELTEAGYHCSVIECPKRGMKEQINYAMEVVLGWLTPDQHSTSFCAIYNADSRPHPESFRCFATIAKQQNIEVAVQNSVHFANFNSLPWTLRGILLRAAAIFQARWSMEEISMQRSQSRFWSTRDIPLSLWDSLHERLAYCIGHGSFFRLDVWRDVGGFPYGCELDDLPLGFLLTCKGVSIHPIPLLENCETPIGIRDLINQKANWYRMMIDYLAPRRIALTQGWARCFRVNLITLRSFIRDAGSWGLISLATLASFSLPLFLDKPVYLLASLTGFFLFSFWGTWKILCATRLIADCSDGNEAKTTTLQRLLVVAFTLPYCLIASVGPWKTLWRKLLGRGFKEHKTER